MGAVGDSNNSAAKQTTTKPAAAKTATTPTTTTTPRAPKSTTLTDAQIRDAVRSQYGYLAAFLDIPEVGKVLMSAAKQGFDTDRLLGQLEKTKWWKTTTASARTFDAEAKLDPATHATKLKNASATIASQASQAGVNLDPETLKQLTFASLRYGWTNDQITQAIGHQFHYNPNAKNTDIPAVEQIKNMASQYLVPLSNQTINTWAQQMIGGKVTPDNLKAYFTEQAKSLFPTLGPALDSGVTTSQYVEPYKQLAAQTLEVPPDSVNFMDPKWNKALFQVDPKTGARTSMSLNDWATTLRTDPTYGYDKTSQAKQAAADLTTQLGQTFGAL